MSDQNPYSAPEAELASESFESGDFELHDPKSCSFGSGASWLGSGFEFFKQSPGGWILTLIVGFVLMMVLMIIPIGNFVMHITGPLWLGGIMIGLRAQSAGEDFKVGYLFAGFKQKFGPLFLLGLLAFVISFAVMAAVMGQAYFQMIQGDVDAMAESASSILLGILIATALLLPLSMAIWFAPALIVLNDVGVIKAMKLSFVACLKNILPLLLWSILSTLLMIVASIPLGLGLLIAVPMLYGSTFAAYKEIFVD